MGREDLARQALQRREALLARVNGYKVQLAQFEAQETHLADVQSKVEARIAAFQGQKEMLSAQYGAAKASVGANEAVSGLCHCRYMIPHPSVYFPIPKVRVNSDLSNI